MKFRNSKAFALPAVLISSIVMLIVMLSAVTSTVAVRVSLDSQYYNQLSRIAGDAGTAYAKACLAQNGGVAKWSDAKPLMPNTDCSGDQLAGFTCTTANQLTEPRCSVMVADGNTVASFSVKAPTVDSGGKAVGTNSVGDIKKVTSTSNSVWRRYSVSIKSTKFDQVTVNLATIKQISSGNQHNCAIASDSQAYCWGNNSFSQLGNNASANSSVPVSVYAGGVFSGKTIKSISTSAGSFHTCAIASNDLAYCWGRNDSNQLGDGTANNSNIPVAVNTSGVLSGKTIKAISAGSFHTCAIASNDLAYCWGSNYFGQFGNGTNTNSSVPVAVSTSGLLSGKTIKDISVGDNHTCVLASDNQVYCWGYGSYGQLGNNVKSNSYNPVAVITSGVFSGKTIKSISAGGNHTCAIASDDLAYCWGQGDVGQLGNNSNTDSSVPVAVTISGALNGKTVKSISSGFNGGCVVASDDKSYCWGQNNAGQLGNGQNYNIAVPVATTTSGVLNGKTIKSVSSSNNHACAVSTEGQVYCWGNNSSGELGNATTTNSLVAVGVYVSCFDYSKLFNAQTFYYSY